MVSSHASSHAARNRRPSPMLAIIIPGIIVLVALAISGVLIIFVVKVGIASSSSRRRTLCKAEELVTGRPRCGGKIVPLEEDDLLTSPMTRTACVYYRFLADGQDRTVSSYQNGRSVDAGTESYWHTIVDDVQAVETAVQDKTGEALVDLARRN